MLFKSKARDEFKVEDILSDAMRAQITRCTNIYRGIPEWVDADDHIKTINFAKTICSETARLATKGMTVDLDGNAQAEWMQDQLNAVMDKLRAWLELGLACGTVVLKPNGRSVNAYRPDEVMVTDCQSDKITGMVFFNHDIDATGKKYYTRLEYHHLTEGNKYEVTNVCFVGSSRNDMGEKVDIENTPWAGMSEYISLQEVERPLFAVLKTPSANNIDFESPMGLPLYTDAIEELKDLDIAYSRYMKEIIDSKRTVLLDSDRLIIGNKIANTASEFEHARDELGLPDYVKNVRGDGAQTFYQEINPTLQTDVRLSGINAILSQIGYKVGFSNGYFVFNEKTGFITATQVESEQARTIQLIDDIRREIKICMYDLVYAIGVFGDLMLNRNIIAREEFNETIYTDDDKRKVHIHFTPIYSNAAEDRQRALTLTQSNYYPKWYYLHMYEGLSVEEAKRMVEEASPKQPTLFGDEE